MWSEGRCEDQGNNKGPEMDPNLHVRLTLDSDAKTVPWRNGNLLHKRSWESWESRCTKVNIGPDLACMKK